MMEPDTRTREQIEQAIYPKARFDCKYIFANRRHLYFKLSIDSVLARCDIDNKERICEGKCSRYNPGIIGRIKWKLTRKKPEV